MYSIRSFTDLSTAYGVHSNRWMKLHLDAETPSELICGGNPARVCAADPELQFTSRGGEEEVGLTAGVGMVGKQPLW